MKFHSQVAFHCPPFFLWHALNFTTSIHSLLPFACRYSSSACSSPSASSLLLRSSLRPCSLPPSMLNRVNSSILSARARLWVTHAQLPALLSVPSTAPVSTPRMTASLILIKSSATHWTSIKWSVRLCALDSRRDEDFTVKKLVLWRAKGLRRLLD
ncbi:hypothetical protein B0H16DRAFT_1895978 [Mycena metata]|uniref:Uncharacterized protein n=1 Tax=Mycena metata TaxID=1033252 RepID=A0AAD7HLU2_9AGAR|nr:hypothetical protein B0H16DRAFT_1895978 [Mycena metata]